MLLSSSLTAPPKGKHVETSRIETHFIASDAVPILQSTKDAGTGEASSQTGKIVQRTKGGCANPPRPTRAAGAPSLVQEQACDLPEERCMFILMTSCNKVLVSLVDLCRDSSSTNGICKLVKK